jgi:hypothetical protein
VSARAKELGFATGVLVAAGLSPAYASIVAERVIETGAQLNAGDAEYLALIRKAQRFYVESRSPRWSNAN